MSKTYDRGYIKVGDHELHYHFERAVILGQPGEPKEVIPNEGGLVLRGDINTLIDIFENLKESKDGPDSE